MPTACNENPKLDVRGLRRSRAVRCLKQLLRHHKPQVIFFMKTKLCSQKIKPACIRCSYQHGLEIDAIGSKGGLCLAWKEDIEVTLLKFAANFIDVLVRKDLESI